MCSDVLLIELECKHCKLRFNICRKCYRGHVYPERLRLCAANLMDASLRR
jgi:hypothetical protein